MPNLNTAVLYKGSADRVQYLENFKGPYFSTMPAPYSTYVTTMRSSVTTPFFKTRKRPNPLPFNPFSYSLRNLEMWNGHYSRRSVYPASPSSNTSLDDVGYRDQGVTGIASPFTNAQLQSLREKHNMKLLSKIKNQKVNLAQAFGERHQAVRMFEGTASRIVSCVSNLRKGNFVGAATALGVAPKRRMTKKFERTFGPKTSERMSRKLRRQEQSALVADGWLALQYGWLPLFSDLYGAVESIADSRLPAKAYATARSRDKLEVDLNCMSSGIRTVSGVGIYEISSCIRYSASPTGSPLTKPLKQLGITNPVNLAWELLPYSFVVDWFLPIGQFLNSLDATAGVTFEGGCQTIFQKYEGVAEISQHLYTPGALGSYTSVDQYWKSSEKLVFVNRNILSSFPTPILPSFQNPFSVRHTANAMALLQQTFRK